MRVSKFRNKTTNRMQFRVYCEQPCRPFEVINDFLRYLDKRLFAANTVRAYAYDLIRYFKYLSIVQIQWASISVDNLVDYIYHLRHANLTKCISNIPTQDCSVRSESTINRMLSAVLSFYKFYYLEHGALIELGDKGVFDESHSSNSAHHFLSFATSSRPNSLRRRQRLIKNQTSIRNISKTLDKIEQNKILSLCRNKRDQLLILLLLETGLRIGQALQLKHQDIQPWEQKLLIEYRVDNDNEVYAKSIHNYDVHLSDDWISLYTDYVAYELDNSNSDYIFIKLYRKNKGNINDPLKYESVKLLFNRFSKELGRTVTPHMLRHTHATELLRAGVPIEIVAKRLGHRSIETTKKIYEHLTAQDMKNILKKARDNNNEQT